MKPARDPLHISGIHGMASKDNGSSELWNQAFQDTEKDNSSKILKSGLMFTAYTVQYLSLYL
jgi:hypothetical protein